MSDPDPLLCFSFNQDSTCVAVGTNNGYRIFNCEPFGRNVYTTDGGIGLVEMLFSTSLVALVGGGDNPAFSHRRLKLWNTQHASAICEIDFNTRVLSVKLNRKRMVVVLQGKIHLYDLNTMKNLHVLDTSVTNTSLGICALSPNDENCYLAVPTGVSGGDVLLYDAKNLSVLNVIQAHKNALGCLAFSQDGTLLATASSNGTLIRVFDIPSGTKRFVFRRGAYPATIHSIAFDKTNTWLGVTSSSKTAHVFKLSKPQTRERSESHVSSLVSGVSELLPGGINDLVEPERSFASTKLTAKSAGQKSPRDATSSGAITSVCAVSEDVLQVVTSENVYYEYGITPGVLEKLREIPLRED